jgi:hypothetical protein
MPKRISRGANDEIRINIENENLEYIRNNKKIIKAFQLNKEIHFYGIKSEIRRFIVTPRGACPLIRSKYAKNFIIFYPFTTKFSSEEELSYIK